MIRTLRNLLLAITISVVGGLVLVPAISNADSALKQDACQGVSQLGGSGCTSAADTTVSTIIQTVVTILSIIVGFIAVVMIIVGGLKMITSNGDSNAIASARSTVVYALIGLIIVALAQILVHFVLHKTKAALVHH